MSVVVPFRGDVAGARRLVESLGRLELSEGDEVVVADNSDDGVVEGSRLLRVVRAVGVRSSYYARNEGARSARGDWLLFTDADCVPSGDLLGAYLAGGEPGERVGALAGTVRSDPDQSHFLARYASDRGFLDQEAGLHTADDAAATANLMVRRAAFEEVGGFEETVVSAGDVDFCRRIAARGWTIERRPEAVVTHLHRESLPDLMRTFARYGAGASWLNERYPGSAPQWPLVPGLLHCGRDMAGDLARLRLEQAAFRGVDAMGLVAHSIGYSRSNKAS